MPVLLDMELWFFDFSLSVNFDWAWGQVSHSRVGPGSVMILRGMVRVTTIVDMSGRVGVDFT
jgi:hypothetical protein